MKKTRFTEAQIFSILEENESGVSAPDLSRKHGLLKVQFMLGKASIPG